MKKEVQVGTASMMNKYLCSSLLILSVLVVSWSDASAAVLRVEVSPRRINPGDAFLIRVMNAKPSEVPVVSFAGDEFVFSTCGEGCFVAIGAADIKSIAGMHGVRLKIGDRRRNLKISVRKVRFPSVKLTIPEDKVSLSPGDMERVEDEKKRLDGIFGTISDRLWDGVFVMPLENGLSTAFGVKRVMNAKWTSVHKGIDIRGNHGEEIRASNYGRVALAEELFFGGNTVIIDHGKGVFTYYMHLSEMKVTPGDLVSKNEVIGCVGSTGRSTGPHLHFGAKVMNIPINPVSLTELRL